MLVVDRDFDIKLIDWHAEDGGGREIHDILLSSDQTIGAGSARAIGDVLHVSSGVTVMIGESELTHNVALQIAQRSPESVGIGKAAECENAAGEFTPGDWLDV